MNTALDVLDGDTSSVGSLLSNMGPDGRISLREAIIATNNTSSADVILFDPSLNGTTLTLTRAGANEDAGVTGDLDISDDLTILGNGASSTIIDGGGIDRVFDVMSGFTVVFDSLTIQNGILAIGNGGGLHSMGSDLTLTNSVVKSNQVSSGRGGGIFFSSTLARTLTIDNSTINNNTANLGIVNPGGGGIAINSGNAIISDSTIAGNQFTGSNSQAGGISFLGTAATSLTIERSTISGNMADDIGGIFVRGNADIENTTISGNQASIDSGGIEVLTDFVTSFTITLLNTTITNNTAGNSGGGLTPTGTGNLILQNTIVANNFASVDPDIGGAFSFAAGSDFNLIGDVGLGTGLGPNSILGTGLSPVDPLLAPLADNGGPTRTHDLLPGSPAVNAGSNALSNGAGLATDQREGAFSRIFNGTVEIGAVEAQPTPTLTIVLTPGAAATGVLVVPIVGQQFTILVGSFTINFPATVSDFLATIDWGDGTIESTPITANGLGVFNVTGTHTYLTESTFLVNLTIDDFIRSTQVQATAGAAVVLTAGQNQNLFSSSFTIVPPGGGQATISTTGVSATLVQPDGTTNPATLFVARFDDNPLTGNNTQGVSEAEQAVVFYDVRVTGAAQDAQLTVTFSFAGSDGTNPVLRIFDSQTQTFRPVQGSGNVANSLVVDSNNRTITVILDSTSFPQIGQLTGTVFTISVTPTPTSTSSTFTTVNTSLTPSVAIAADQGSSQLFANGQQVGFQTSSQLTLSLNASQDSLASTRTTPSGGRGEEDSEGEKADKPEVQLDSIFEYLRDLMKRLNSSLMSSAPPRVLDTDDALLTRDENDVRSRPHLAELDAGHTEVESEAIDEAVRSGLWNLVLGSGLLGLTLTPVRRYQRRPTNGSATHNPPTP